MAEGRFLRDNAFLVAAVCLPVAVAGLFMLASAIPRSTVPPPAYDLVFKVAQPYGVRSSSGPTVDFIVRDGHVEARIEPPPPSGSYDQTWTLLLFDHVTQTVREIPFEVPRATPADGTFPATATTLTVEALTEKRLMTQSRAPDGYELQNRMTVNRGLVGELFGMSSSRYRAPALVNDGRTVELDLPARFTDFYRPPVYALGWLADEGTR
jgi:hypothetical protein